MFFEGIRLWQIDHSETVDDRATCPYLTSGINLNLPLRQSQGTFVTQDGEPVRRDHHAFRIEGERALARIRHAISGLYGKKSASF